MNANQLVGRLGIPREGDENGVIAPRGLSKITTELFNRWWGFGTVVEHPYRLDNTKAIYTLIK